MFSVAIVSFNRRDLIVKCIGSVLDIADEIVVVDSMSDDGTDEVARELGAKVVRKKFDDICEQKKFAISLCKNDWVLSLDTDEMLSDALRGEIKKLNFKETKFDGFMMKRRNIYLGKPVVVWYPDWVLRLFRKSKAFLKGEIVHERIEVYGKIGKLKGDIVHMAYSSCEEHFAKTLFYGKKSALKKLKDGEKFYRVKLMFSPFWEFFRHLVIKGGWKDGMRGLIISYSAMMDRVIRYSLVWEWNNMENEKNRGTGKIEERESRGVGKTEEGENINEIKEEKGEE